MNQLQDTALAGYVKSKQAVDREFERIVAGIQEPEKRTAMWYGWIFIVGALIVAAAVAWATCRAQGYRGFRGGMSVKRGPWGVVLGTYLECY